MLRRPPRTTSTDTLFPYTTLFRSQQIGIEALIVAGSLDPYITGAQTITQGCHDRNFITSAVDTAAFGDETLPLPIGEWQWKAIGKVARLSCVRIANDIDGFDQRTEEQTSELQSLIMTSSSIF